MLGYGAKKVLDFITSILAFLTVLLFAFLYANAVFDFGIAAETISLLYVIREYMVLATIVLVGLEFAVTKGFLFLIIYCVIAALVVIFSFFPEVANQLTGLIS
ncbi:MAG TPA: hypothetical protein H9686_04230 [Firmicutes bacterium]|nr:hypothetical protein [Bacillota bacterium]